jgi:hypothetical protein
MLIYIVLCIIDVVMGTFSEEARVGLLSGIYGLVAVYLVDTTNRSHCAHCFLSV